MPYHVSMFEFFDERKTRGKPTFLDIQEEELRDRIVQAWDQGAPVTWSGRTADSARADIHVFRTDKPLPAETDGIQLRAASEDVTNEWITGPAGQAATVVGSGAAAALDALRNPRRAMVVHGRNLRARDALLASSARWDSSLSSGSTLSQRPGWRHPTTSRRSGPRWSSGRR